MPRRRPPTATEIRRATDAGRVRLLDIALRELERADKAEAKASKVFERKGGRVAARTFSKAAKAVDEWATVVERITKRFHDDAEKAERRRLATRRPMSAVTRRRVDREHEAQLAYMEAEALDAEWEFSCEYLAGEGSSNVDVNFRIRRNDGRPFSADEAKRAMQTFRGQVAAGLMTAPPGYRIAGIDWRRPSKRQVGWTKHGEFPHDLGGLENVLYIAADHPSLWRLGGVDD